MSAIQPQERGKGVKRLSFNDEKKVSEIDRTMKVIRKTYST